MRGVFKLGANDINRIILSYLVVVVMPVCESVEVGYSGLILFLVTGPLFNEEPSLHQLTKCFNNSPYSSPPQILPKPSNWACRLGS